MLQTELHNRLINATKSKNSIDVRIQDQSTERLSLYLAQPLDLIVSISGGVKDTESLNITTSGVVPVIGNFVCFQEGGNVTQMEIISVTPVSGNEYTIGIAIPLDHDYSASAGCVLQNVDMDVDGSLTPVEFKIGPAGNYSWDITRLNVAMVLSTAGDDGLFGNLTALTASQYFRKENSGHTKNLFDVKDNSDFRLESGGDVAYTTRSGGGGSYGMASRITFNGADKSGVVIRLIGDTDDTFTTVVRSNLTGIVKYRIKVQGHVVEE
jgi:hypothetical protein